MPTPQPALTERFLAHLDGDLESTDAFLADASPATTGGASRCIPSMCLRTASSPTFRKVGQAALAAVEEHGGMEQVCAVVGVSDDLIVEVAPRVEAKLAQEPIEDLRLDFEDGYGNRGDEAEDSDSVAAAAQLAAAVRRASPHRSPGCGSSASRRRPVGGESVPSTCSSAACSTHWAACRMAW